MSDHIRINMANPEELQELGIGAAGVDAIIRFRREHGPITDAQQLGAVIGGHPMPAAAKRLDFSPSDTTAPEAPGA